MSYSNKLSTLMLGEEASPPAVTVTLWRTWTTISDEGTATEHESALGSITVPTGRAVPFSIGDPALQPVAPSSADFVVVSVQTPGEQGYLFRSPRLAALPNPGTEADNLDIWLTGPISIDQAAVTAALPALPIVVDATTTITGLTATLTDGGIDLVATGPVVGPATPFSAPTTNGFTYRVPITITPALLHEPEAAVVASAGAPTLTFGGTGLGNSLSSAVLNALAPMIADDVLPNIMGRINAGITAAAVDRAVAALGTAGATLPPGGGLPPGVSMSADHVTITTETVTIWASLHAFGSLTTIMFPGRSTSGTGCALPALVLLLAGAASGAAWLQ